MLRNRIKPAYLLSFMLPACIAQAHAASVVTAVPASARPTTALTVAGTGFGASEAVDVYFDTTDTLLVVAAANGSFSASVTVPTSAAPGVHYATAIGRHSGDAAQAAVTVTTPWAQLGYGHAHQNNNPYENTLNTSNVGQLGLLWGTSVGAILSAPAVANGKVFATGNGITAMNAGTGAVLWTADATDSFYSSPAVVSGIVYAGSNTTDSLYAVNGATGAKKWTATLGGTTRSSPLVVNGVVYIGCNDDKVYALNATTGAILWTYATGNQVASSPALADGVLYVGSLDDKLYALNPTTGALIWSFTTGGIIYSSPAVYNGVVYVGSYDDKLYAIAAGTEGGSQLWAATTSGVIFAAPTVVGNKVIVGSEDDNVYAYNTRTGALQWQVNTGAPVDGTAAVGNGVAYLGNNAGNVLAIDISYGGIIASMEAPPYVVAGVALSDGVVYFTGEYTKTYAYALRAGTDVARAPAQAPRRSDLRPNLSLPAMRSLS